MRWRKYTFFGKQERMNPAGSRPRFHQPGWLPNASARWWLALTVIALLVGISLRVMWLDQVPPGFNQDEACNGYDAYSILRTGRDQHGHLFPLVIQGFNDYRMPMFDYSLVPLVGLFGLKPAVVRLGAAIWGIVDLLAMTILGGVLLGLPGAAAAALLGALSPWHLPFSRFAIEATCACAVTTLAMLCFFLWMNSGRERWLWLSAVFFAVSLYTYSITKAFTPLIIGWLAVSCWGELGRVKARALGPLALIVAGAIPQAALVWFHPAEMSARFGEISVAGRWVSLSDRAEAIAAHLARDFSPSFLFLSGDHYIVLHPPGFGELLPEQAPLIALALFALFIGSRRRLAIVLLGWLICAGTAASLVRLSPSLHNLFAITPWVLFSALGFVTLLDVTGRLPVLRVAAVGLIGAGVVFHGVQFVRSYFIDYPLVAAKDFQYGLEEVVHSLGGLGDSREAVVFPLEDINQPYIYVLFFTHYPPDRFQRDPVVRMNGLMGPVLRFDRYLFGSPESGYEQLEHGIFIFADADSLPAGPALTVRYPDGKTAYNVVLK
jgi:hypothetical protein